MQLWGLYKQGHLFCDYLYSSSRWVHTAQIVASVPTFTAPSIPSKQPRVILSVNTTLCVIEIGSLYRSVCTTEPLAVCGPNLSSILRICYPCVDLMLQQSNKARTYPTLICAHTEHKSVHTPRASVRFASQLRLVLLFRSCASTPRPA